jgi:Protein of unknown function (DUF3631)
MDDPEGFKAARARLLHYDRQPRPLTQPALADVLRDFDIVPKTIWPMPHSPGSKSRKGYHRRQFDAAWRAYRRQGATCAWPQGGAQRVIDALRSCWPARRHKSGKSTGYTGTRTHAPATPGATSGASPRGVEQAPAFAAGLAPARRFDLAPVPARARAVG